ncbi:Hypothetical predicted protein [Cloeon dipterum]|uniref:Uncharacterized protein n=1 Tax=Cloeon dipterum TaxID=197152 RepID=A0A8S1DAW4_9INSE|nr:Hypothetical predicted protein [Cloeon dipterum]
MLFIGIGGYVTSSKFYPAQIERRKKQTLDNVLDFFSLQLLIVPLVCYKRDAGVAFASHFISCVQLIAHIVVQID